MLYSNSQSPAKHERAGERPGEGIGGSKHKGSLIMYPWLRTEDREARPGPLLPRRAQQLRFLLPCLPVMRIIPASAGWQAQHGLCSGSGSGSGISTRARAFSRPRAPGTPVSSAPCETGVSTRQEELRPREKGGGGFN